MIVKRLKEYIDFKGISIAAFERSIGMSNASFGKSLKNNGAIGTDKLENILFEYPDISPIWLLTGEGEMIKSDNNNTGLIPVNPHEGGIPLIPIDAWAGVFHGEEPVSLSECEHFFVPAFKDADFLIPVRGDSMVPRYYSGDLVACKYLPLSDIFFQWGKVYVLDTNQGALIKKVRPGSSNDTITLISENDNYEPFELPRSAIYNIAIVQGIIRSE